MTWVAWQRSDPFKFETVEAQLAAVAGWTRAHYTDVEFDFERGDHAATRAACGIIIPRAEPAILRFSDDATPRGRCRTCTELLERRGLVEVPVEEAT